MELIWARGNAVLPQVQPMLCWAYAIESVNAYYLRENHHLGRSVAAIAADTAEHVAMNMATGAINNASNLVKAIKASGHFDKYVDLPDLTNLSALGLAINTSIAQLRPLIGLLRKPGSTVSHVVVIKGYKVFGQVHQVRIADPAASKRSDDWFDIEEAFTDYRRQKGYLAGYAKTKPNDWANLRSLFGDPELEFNALDAL